MKKILMLFAALSVLVLAGCVPGLLTRQTGISAPETRTGTQALEMRFIENAPPATVYVNSSFVAAIELWNKGSYDLLDGVYTISYDKNYLGLSRESGDIPELAGKSIANILGEKRILSIDATAKELPSQMERISLPIVLNACYSYASVANPSVCIDTDVYSEIPQAKKACTVKSVSLGSGQGAPVVISSVEPKMLAATERLIRPEFTITIRNAARGIVVSKNRIYEACTPGAIPYEEFNVADLKVILSTSQLKCRPDNVRFTNGQATVICSLEQGIDRRAGTYAAPLYIELNYGYASSVAKTFELKRIVEK